MKRYKTVAYGDLKYRWNQEARRKRDGHLYYDKWDIPLVLKKHHLRGDWHHYTYEGQRHRNAKAQTQ